MGQSTSRDASSDPSGSPRQNQADQQHQPSRGFVQRLQTHLRRRLPETPAATMFVPQRRRRSATDSVRSERRKRRVGETSDQANVGSTSDTLPTVTPSTTEISPREASLGEAEESQPLLGNITEEPSGPGTTPETSQQQQHQQQPRNQTVMLSRLLFLASAMTASSLVGTEFGFQNGNGTGTTSDDFDQFLAGLSRGLLSPEITSREPSADGTAQPLNYFRMFRFPPTDGSTIVPVLVVGIRSSEDNGLGANAEITTDSMPFFEAATSRPIRLSEPSDASDSDPLRSRYERGRPILDQLMSDFGSSLANSDQRSITDSLLDMPPPTHATSSNEAREGEEEGEEEEEEEDDDDDGDDEEQEQEQGVISSTLPPAPENPSTEPRNTRESLQEAIPERPLRQSWIVYVFGGTYAEDHPILNAASLFTEEPTLDDLGLLERHLSPAKTHLATQKDLDAAGGLSTIEEYVEGEKCPICMTEYEKGDVCRTLKKCNHMFHKDCVDHWLLNGSNSCPMCRGEGVTRA